MTETRPPALLARTEHDLQNLVQQCTSERRAIVDYGVAHQQVGYPPPPEHVRLSYSGGIIEHYERDMAVRVRTGATMAQLQQQLAQAGQFAPIDADDDMTVGEVINHNVYGALRLTYGSMRDLLLGLHYVDGLGQDIHVGGRTVKNVAGYDVSRLMVGSLGQLGLIYEATFRTYAIPETVAIVDLKLHNPASVDPILTDWMLTDAAPGLLTLTADADGWTLRVGYLGTSAACAVQRRALELLLDRLPGIHIAGAGEYTFTDSILQRQAHRIWRRDATSVVKLLVPPAETGTICRNLKIWSEQISSVLNMDALPTHGCIFAGGDLTPEQTLQLDQLVLELVEPHDGMRTWYARPAESVAQFPPFAPPQPDWRVLERVKRTMDPHHLFNPGRLLGRQEQPS